jgi:hypothetical protein
LYALDDHVWGIKITGLKEYTDFTTLDTEKLFSKLKSHELPRKGRPNHNASLSSKALITSTHVGGHDANATNTTVSSALWFVLYSMAASSDEQYESILDDEIAQLVRKFRALHKFCKEMRRSPRGCFEYVDTTQFIADCPKRKKLDSFNKYNNNNNNRNDTSNKGDNKKCCFEDKKKKKKFWKIMSQVCDALSDFDFSSDDFSSSDEDEKVKRKQGDFAGVCLTGKSSRNISDSDVSDDLSPESFSLRVVELGNALCNQDKLLCKVFYENKKLNLELESVFFLKLLLFG